MSLAASRVPLAALLALWVPSALVACGFPDVDYVDTGAGSDVGDAAADATVGDEEIPSSDGAGSDGGPTADDAADGDGATPDDRTIVDDTGDAGATDDGAVVDDRAIIDDRAVVDDRAVADEFVFEAGPDAPPCDKDLDTFLAKTAACGGNDCDDNDPRAHPDADYRTDPPHPPTNGDWNCDGILEKQYTTTNLACGGLSLGQCASMAGFEGNPGCGQADTFITCAPGLLGLTCADGGVETRVQGCK